MDRQIKKPKSRFKQILIFGSICIVLLVGWVALNASKEKSIRIERSRLTMDEVIFSDFQELVTVNGSIEPSTTVQITSNEGGTIEEVYVENGLWVEKDQPIMRMSNASMQLDFMNRETQIIEQINNLRSTRINLDQNKRNVQEQLLEVRYNLLEQRRLFSIDSTLFVQGAIPKADFDQSKNQLDYLNMRLGLLQERNETDELYRQSQLNRIDESINLMERNLEALRKTIDNLTIKSPISGHISQFDHEIGETKARGESIGRIDLLDDFIISAPVDQYYLNRVKLGQTAVAELNGKHYQTEVYKVFPSVENGQFLAYLKFLENQSPDEFRRGQNIRVKLELSAKQRALLLKRGGFYQSSSGKFVYVLKSENEAIKVPISLGSQNPSYFKIESGLAEGDSVITSSYRNFEDYDIIKITN